MNVLVLGAGRMAYGLVFDFLKNEKINGISVIDNIQSALDATKNHFNNPKLNFHKIAADNLRELKPHFDNAAGAGAYMDLGRLSNPDNGGQMEVRAFSLSLYAQLLDENQSPGSTDYLLKATLSEYKNNKNV